MSIQAQIDNVATNAIILNAKNMASRQFNVTKTSQRLDFSKRQALLRLLLELSVYYSSNKTLMAFIALQSYKESAHKEIAN